MRTIAIINQKGGCGKTTVAINLASVLAGRKLRTLLVDVDPQSHCALGLSVPEQQIDRSMADLMRAGMDGSLGLADITWQISRHLDLAPSTMALAGIEQELASAPDRDRRLLQVLAAAADRYDYCVIDCPPAISLLTFNALRAADEVIIPVETGYFALQGAIKQKATIEMLARKANHRVRFEVLATMYDVRTKLAREILAELKKNFGAALLPMVINFNAKLREAASFGQAITEYDPASRGHQDFEKLADWLTANPPAPPVMEAGDAAAATGPAGSPGVASAGNPALSRAAELVERARLLSQRGAALSARVANDLEPQRRRDPGRTQEPGRPQAPAPVESPIPEPVSFGPSPHHAGDRGDLRGGPRQSDPAEMPVDLSTAYADLPLPTGGEIPGGASSGRVLVLDAPTRPARHTANHSAPTATPQIPSARLKPAPAEKLAKLFGVRATAQGLLFVQPLGHALSVCVAGDFNNWSADAHPLRRDEVLGVWQACVKVEPGRHRYRLVVDGLWTHDQHNGNVESNPFGELNSIAVVGAEK